LIGNWQTQKQLRISVIAAKKKNSSVPHVLFSGSAGCGKTSMAKKLAEMSGSDLTPVFPDSLASPKDALKLMHKLNGENYNKKGDRVGEIKPSILFIDEVHNLKLNVQEALGVAMENFAMESGIEGKYVWLPYFTLVGATTNDGKLSKPFRDRFKLRFTFSPYSLKESVDIVRAHAERLTAPMTGKAMFDVARRGRGVPRIMVGHLERAIDFTMSKGFKVITDKETGEMFKEMGIDENGFSETDVKILIALFNSDGPVGQDNLSIITNESPITLSNSIEPYLIQEGMISRTGRGRRITEKGKSYLERKGLIESFGSGLLEADPRHERK
jgi:Holliday junction DNA helicase RuvB